MNNDLAHKFLPKQLTTMKFALAVATLSLLSSSPPPVMAFTTARAASRSTIVSSTSRRSSSTLATANNYFFGNNSNNNNNAASIIAGACTNLHYNGFNVLSTMPRGGSTSSSALQSTTTAEAVAEEIAEDAPKEIFRTDYKPLSYKVSNVSMNFDIRDGKTIVER